MIDNKMLSNFIRNVAKDCRDAAEGSVVESRIDAHITENCRLADHDFNKSLNNIVGIISENQKEDIYNAAMEMITQHEIASFIDGFLYALTLACTED